MKKIILFSAIAVLALCSAGEAAILTGSYSYDPVANLYTYDYALNNTGPDPIGALSILVHSGGFFEGMPVSHTDSASAWTFTLAYSGSIGGPPYNEYGTFWAWHGYPLHTTVGPGNVLTGFSFTTDRAPSVSSNNNYYLYAYPTSGGGYVAEYGHIVAPDFWVPVPEPATLYLIAGSLIGGIAGRMMFRRQDA